VSALIGILISICKTAPIFDKWAQFFVDSYNDEKIKNIQIDSITKQDKKRILLSKISEAKTNEEKRILFSTYNDINKL
jgi:hypothetical protein